MQPVEQKSRGGCIVEKYLTKEPSFLFLPRTFQNNDDLEMPLKINLSQLLIPQNIQILNY